eukprot:Seg1580.3 transcript_id=Seg1580.3/GoldUCD/mRNA.D3Y31 product=Liprin-beta-1 protein_id=Seg1580.3/GoldUCD/D3Y31
MSAVGSEAASMLEKALEEMDDIFKEADQPAKFHSPRHQTGQISFMDNIKMLINNFEKLLVDNIYPVGLNRKEAEHLFQYASNLSYFMLFIEDAANHLHGTSREEILKELETVKREKEAFLMQVGQLSTELESAQQEVETVKKREEVMREEMAASKESMAAQKGEKANELDNLKGHINSIIDEQEKRIHGQDDNTVGLKKRLREKASENSRLKLIVEDLKVSHEEKDNAISRVQTEIERLREENERLLAANKAMEAGMATNRPESNGIEYPRIENDSENGSVFQGARSSSEPNLVRNNIKSRGLAPNTPVMQNSNGRVYSSSSEHKRNVIGRSFATWTMEQISDWLEDEGLAAYIPTFTKVVARGDDVFKMNNLEFEREIGISLHIHQKKLTFALQALQAPGPDYTGRLDHNWVARWLDDIGLPQYKGVFYENRVDGRILQNMTLDDLFHLKVYTTLHHISLKRAIQCLRHQQFHPNYLKPCLTPQNEDRCNHVMLWTNGRVMDWLRSVDLAEYAPNLRGSGVHGALMILEPRFNADTLANMLSISQSKTLLRRHLQSQFETLLSENCQKQKELTAKSPDFLPLSASEKHKLRKKGPFGTLRRRKSELELDQCICPMDLDVPQSISPPPALDPDDVFEFSDTLSSPAVSNEQDCSTENGLQSKTMGDLSHDITNLTSVLNQSR